MGAISEGEVLPWFALFLKGRHEKFVAATLRQKGYEEFLPLYRHRHRHAGKNRWAELPLFPGYTFCRFDPNERLDILKTPGVLSIIGNRFGPVSVDDAEIQAIQVITRSGTDVQPWPFVDVGERVHIVDGPLAGLEGTLMRHDGKYRVVVSVCLLQRSVAAEVSRDAIRPAMVSPGSGRL